MREMIIPLDWEYIDKLLENIDSELTREGCPTVLRMRAQLGTEELFRALMALENTAGGKLRFLRTAPNAFVLQFRDAQGVLRPDTGNLEALDGTAALYGVKMQLQEGSCTVTVGVK